jgi:hypothetical protein
MVVIQQEEHAMTPTTPSIFRTIARYAGKIRTMHENIRAERVMNALPAELRKDIGWPDMLAERRAGRRGQ